MRWDDHLTLLSLEKMWSCGVQENIKFYRLILLKFGPRNPPGNVHMEGPNVDDVGQRRATTTACFCDAAGHLPDSVSLSCPSEVLL